MDGFDVTHGLLVVLAVVSGVLCWDFVRQAKSRSVVAILGAILGHALLAGFLALDPGQRFGCGMDLGHGDRFDFEVAELIPEPPPTPKPPEPEPEPEPPVEPVVSKPRVKSPAPKPLPSPAEEPAPPLRFDLRSLGGSGTSGVLVDVGDGGGIPEGLAGGGGKKPKVEGGGDLGGDADGWAPASELSLESMPAPLSVPRIQCKEAIELGLEGTVILEVQVRDDGKIRQVKVLKGMGNGCDAVARKALRGARFTPAIDRTGRKVDFQLRYEYEFKLAD